MKLSNHVPKNAPKPNQQSSAPKPEEARVKGPNPGDGPGVGGGYRTIDGIDLTLVSDSSFSSTIGIDSDGPGVGGGYFDRNATQNWILDNQQSGSPTVTASSMDGYSALSTQIEQGYTSYEWTGPISMDSLPTSSTFSAFSGGAEGSKLDWGYDGLSYNFSGL